MCLMAAAAAALVVVLPAVLRPGCSQRKSQQHRRDAPPAACIRTMHPALTILICLKMALIAPGSAVFCANARARRERKTRGSCSSMEEIFSSPRLLIIRFLCTITPSSTRRISHHGRGDCKSGHQDHRQGGVARHCALYQSSKAACFVWVFVCCCCCCWHTVCAAIWSSTTQIYTMEQTRLIAKLKWGARCGLKREGRATTTNSAAPKNCPA